MCRLIGLNKCDRCIDLILVAIIFASSRMNHDSDGLPMQSQHQKACFSRNSRVTVTLVGCVTYTFLFCAAFRFANQTGIYLLMPSILLLAYCLFSDEQSWVRVSILCSLIFDSGLVALGLWPVTLENAMIGVAAAVAASQIMPVRMQAVCSVILLTLVAMALIPYDLPRERMCECWQGFLLVFVGLGFGIFVALRRRKRRTSNRTKTRKEDQEKGSGAGQEPKN